MESPQSTGHEGLVQGMEIKKSNLFRTIDHHKYLLYDLMTKKKLTSLFSSHKQ